MGKLNQIVAVEKGIKKDVYAELTAAHHVLQQQKPLFGISRTYQPLTEDGTRYPSESVLVQIRTKEIIDRTAHILTKLFDVVATKDWANCEARADVVVNGNAILKQVPVTYLIFLEKQLIDIHTFVKKLPVLDPSESWQWDDATNCYRTPVKQTMKTVKKPFPFVKSPATKEHPAQVEVVQQDINEGTWNQVGFSGALPASVIQELLDRVEDLQKAVKFAREEANGCDVTDRHTGKLVFDYLFGNLELNKQ